MLGSGEAMLFTGAGFSASALSRAGGTLPTTEEVTQEIWALCFAGEPRDDSSLTDLFHYAQHHRPRQLEALMKRRLCVEPGTLDAFYERWFNVPWKRAWTLNVDNIEVAAARQFRLTRPIRTLSALATRFEARLLQGAALPFIHLNGFINGGISQVTFSTTQYGDRLAQADPWYEQFVNDLVNHPFVVVGTRLEEAPFWRNLQALCGNRPPPPGELCRAVIVSPSLTRARRLLLEDLGMRWMQSSAQQFAQQVLDPPIVPARRRHPADAGCDSRVAPPPSLA